MLAPIRIKVQLLCGAEIAMGPGKADLIAAIAAHGSISAAARALGMSYRRAWLLVDTMNRCWKEPLIHTVPGAGRAGASVTALGARVLAEYRALQSGLAANAEEHRGLAEALRPVPRPKAGAALTPSG